MKALIFLFLASISLIAAPFDEKQIDARIDALGKPTAQDSVKALEVWKSARAYLTSADQAVSEEKDLRAKIEKLINPAPFVPPTLPSADAPLTEHVQLSEKISALLDTNQRRMNLLKEREEESPQLRTALAEALVKTQTELSDLEVPVLGVGELAAARYQEALQKKRLLEAQLAKIIADQEQVRLEADLFGERERRRLEHISNLKDLQATLNTTIDTLKEKEAADTRATLEKSAELFQKIPDLAAIVNEVKELNDQHSGENGLLAQIKIAQEYRESIQQTRNRTTEQYTNAASRIKLLEDSNLGVDDETGLILRSQRASLTSTDEISTELRFNLQRAAEAQLAALTLSDSDNPSLKLTEKRINEILKEHPELTRDRIEDLLNQRSKIMRSLDDSYRELNTTLTQGTEIAKHAIAEIEEYSGFIDERLLWIKSTKPLSATEPLDEWNRIVALFSPATLANVWSSISSSWFKKIPLSIFVLLLSLVVFIRRHALREVLTTSSKQAARRNCTSLTPTLKNIGAAVLLSLGFPVLIFLASEHITSPDSWRIGLLRLSVYLFIAALLLKFSRKDGLFVSHFKMPRARAALIQKSIRWIYLLAIPLVFLVSALTHVEGSPSSGRLTFIIALFVGAGFLHHLFHPKRSLLQKEAKITLFTQGTYLLIMAIPIVLAVGAALGYFASVLILRGQVGATAMLLVLAFLVIRFLTRCILVSRRRLAIKQALRRREAVIAERERAAEGLEKVHDLPSLEEVKSEAVNVVEVEVQTTQLMRLASYAAVFFGLWAIWSSTLPALTVLEKVKFGSVKNQTVEAAQNVALIPNLNAPPEAEPEPEAETATDSETEDAPAAQSSVDKRISLQDIILSLVYFALTFIAARNIPSLLSLTLFNRINLGPGGNYGLTTTVRYLIVLVGIVIALSQIGITWGKVQWLAAAVTLGIGFGLQEIFANFVAGIILLFERPIRLGDVVTVGEISGRVTQIKIRATTIQQFNNRELLVPNKEFITSQLVNWTLKDSVLRFEISVGIAYGSDTEKATDILKSILKDHPDVLDEPKPDVLFVAFGNSTLDFNVRGFVSSVEHLIIVQSDLHYLIDNAFREGGIEIAFPQQDIHLRSLPEGITLSQKA